MYVIYARSTKNLTGRDYGCMGMETMSVLHLLLGLNNSGKASFSTARCELLLCLSRQRIDLQMEQAWTPIVGPLEHNIARFVSRGFLEEAPLADKFDAKYGFRPEADA
jgi:hypothetical protein